MFQLIIVLVLAWYNFQYAMDYQELSLKDRCYNEVIFPATHNGTANQGPDFKTLDLISVQNQNRSLEDQFNAGIRSMKVPLHDTCGGVKACHGVYKRDIEKEVPKFVPQWIIDEIAEYPCYVDPATRPLEDVLVVIREFLDNNQQEIFTLFLEDNTHNHEKIAQCFSKAKLNPKQYAHKQDKKSPWPRISQMLQADKRLVVFISSEDENHSYDWLLCYKDFIWSTAYAFPTVDALRDNTDIRGGNSMENYEERMQAPHNKVAVMQHFVTPSDGNFSWEPPWLLGGDLEAAKKANTKEIMLSRYKALLKKSHVPLNFIWVDFFEEGDLFEVVREINNPHEKN